MRRDVGRHADRDPGRTVDQKIRYARRQYDGFLVLAVVVGLEVDGVEVDILEQRLGGARHADFGVTHGRRRIAVHGPEITLPIDQRHAHGKFLRHANQRVVDRLVTVRMVLTNHVTDDTGRLSVGLVMRIARLMHRVEDAPVHRFQTIAGIRQRTAHDHAHGVVEIGALHLVFDGDGQDFATRTAGRTGGRAVVFRVGQGGL